MLRHLPAGGDPRILVSAATRDDAAVYRIDADRALVATVDFFTPIVDDAAAWGRIVAANALSDLYAMGATPLCALSLVGWPRDTLPLELLGEAIDGMVEVTTRARCPIVGGHSVDAVEPHLGLVALGEAHPDRLLTNAAGRAGDLLVLTKPLGTGILSTALKRGLIGEEEMVEAIAAMTALNRDAMDVALRHGVRAATDVTGFGLLGHLRHLLDGSGVGARLWLSGVPCFPAARPLAEAEVVPGGTVRNLEAAASVIWGEGITRAERLLLADAQTSGGLLLATPPSALKALLEDLATAGTLARSVIGELTAESGVLRVTRER